MHLVLGNGNLGRSLANQLAQRGLTYKLLDKSEFCYPEKTLLMDKPTHVWCCIGAGSVNRAKEDFNGVISTHVQLPIHLMKTLPEKVKLVFFSTDYVADEKNPSLPLHKTSEPRSLYALSKLWLEQSVVFSKRANTCVVRVGSLYGRHFPERTFPGRLRANYPVPGPVTLPRNLVTPTPTDWLAEGLLDTQSKFMFTPSPCIKHCAPKGNVSVAHWGRLILDKSYTVYEAGYDEERPKISDLNCSFWPPEDWKELWEKYTI